MKVPFSWLKELVDVDMPAQELKSVCSAAGLKWKS